LAKNLLRDDPTRTLTLRNRAVSEINRRYGEVKSLINQSFVDEQIFSENAQPLRKESFVFLRLPEKLEQFDVWMESVLNELILQGSVDVNSPTLNWMLQYFEEAYERGVRKANNEMAATLGRNQIPIRTDVFKVPFHIEKVSLLFARDFAQLKGITEVMSQQMSFVLSDGLLKGENPLKIAKKLNERVDKIGITRSRLLARTEIINSHNFGKANEGQALSELLGEEVVYLWRTAGDIKVRPAHVERNKKYYTYEKVITLIGEPNCRCSINPVPVSRLPEDAIIIGL
jgi:hypothetical protein